MYRAGQSVVQPLVLVGEMGSSLILRLKGSVVAHSLQRISAGIKGARMMSSGVSDESPSRIISSSPWLTLPPAFEGSDMVFNLYKLAEKKVETIKMGSQELELPDDINDVRIVGSSHGWLALFNRCNNQMFLSNPITHELIKLPPVHTLPDPRFNLRDGHWSVSKMIISCSPHEEECRAMMTFGPADRLAFCWPGSSTEWTPIGDLFLNYEDPQFRYARVYEDLAYCSRSKLFTCITHSNETEDWNLSDPGAPELEWRWYLSLEGRVEDWDDIRDSRSAKTNWDRLAFMFQGYKSPWWKENLELLQLCRQIPYQVFVNESDDMPLIVMRFLFKDTCIPLDNHDSGRKFPAYSNTYPDKTVGFFVYNFEEGFMKLVEDSLDGLAIFVGSNNSFVVSAAEFPGILEPNSIYFTNSDTKKISGIRHDIGIFNYEKKAFSPFLLPYDVPSTASPPIWFTSRGRTVFVGGMGSLILRLKGSAAHSLRRISAGINGARMMSTTTNSGVSDESPSKISSLPWLMLPPKFEGGGDMVFNFYKLAEKKVETNKMRYSSLELELPDDIKDVRVLGSSHGWLALFNSCNKDVFLLNPHSGRHIKLPPLSTLPVLECDLEYGDWTAFAVILSCSPDEDEQECRALMIFGAPYRLAFCWPRHSTEWTPIGALHYGDVTCYKNLQFEKPSKYVTSLHSDEDGKSYKVLRIDRSKLVRPYENFVYSSRLKRFFCLTGGRGEDLERWDLRDPGSPRIDWMVKLDELECDEENYPWPASSEEESTFKAECCRQLRYLVVADKSNELFLVTRHINMRMDSDGSYVKCIMFPNGAFDYSYPYKTIGFDVHKIDWEGKRLSYMEGSLDGLAMFVGMNDPFAIPACEFGLEPDCIYFTDDYNVIPPKSLDTSYGGHDIGICKYETGKFSSCYYDYGDYQSIKRILPPPVWFTPLSKPAA